MASVDELFELSKINESENYIIIDEDRLIIIPDNLKNIAVQYDHNIETVTFDCPRYWDGNDMSNMEAHINYVRPDGSINTYNCESISINKENEDRINFNWTITGEVTEFSGKIKFIICLYKKYPDGTKKQVWHSQLCNDLNVLEGLNCDEGVSTYFSGRQDEWSDFWDEFQNNGDREDYARAFYSWPRANGFKPKYDIKPVGSIYSMFNNFNISNSDDLPDFSELFNKLGIKFNTELVTNFTNVFANSNILRVPSLDTRSSTGVLSYLFYKSKIETIDKIILVDYSEETTITRTQSFDSAAFNGCTNLKNLVIEGQIAGNGFNVSWSPLTHESLLSIINALVDLNGDQTFPPIIHKITLGGNNTSKLTSDELKIATDKGWTVV